MTAREFEAWPHKAVTLLGMSGVGKTTLANRLPKSNWFHYSGDYRIGTRYLDEPIVDNIKRQAMQVDFLRDLLRSDSIYIKSNITVDNLQPVSTFLGKIGDPGHGGLSVEEFRRRQRLHHDAEVGAMKDVAGFIEKSRDIYGYDHFVNDAGGSVCEIEDASVVPALAEHTLIPVPAGRRGAGERAARAPAHRPEAALLPGGVLRRAARDVPRGAGARLSGEDRARRLRAVGVPRRWSPTGGRATRQSPGATATPWRRGRRRACATRRTSWSSWRESWRRPPRHRPA